MRRILVVGATSAIAIACARQWANQGSSFFLVARDAQKLDQTAADLRARGARSVAVQCLNATEVDDHPAMLERCVRELDRIDIALVAYGTLPDQKASEQSVKIVLEGFATNCTSVIALLTLLANILERQQHGTLAVISSVAGERGRASNYVYGSAKAAISVYCEGLRARLFRVGVHVATIKPGFVDTPMTKDLRLPKLLVATPQQVARTIVAGINRKAAVIYCPRWWSVIMFVIRSIPSPLFKRLKL